MSEHGRRADGQRRRACLSALLDALAVGVDESNLVLRKVGRRELSIHVTHGEHLIRCGVGVHTGPQALAPMVSWTVRTPASNYELSSASPRAARSSLQKGEKSFSPLSRFAPLLPKENPAPGPNQICTAVVGPFSSGQRSAHYGIAVQAWCSTLGFTLRVALACYDRHSMPAACPLAIHRAAQCIASSAFGTLVIPRRMLVISCP